MEVKVSDELLEPYLFIKNGFIQNDKPKSILVLVEEYEKTIIQFYASFYTNYDSIYIDIC